MAHESPRVEDEEGVRESSGVAEKPWGSYQGVGGGFELPQGTNAPGVINLSQGEKTHGVTTANKGGRTGAGRGRKPPRHTSNRGARRWRRRRRVDGRAKYGSTVAPTQGHGSRRWQCGTPTRHTAGTDGARPKHGALARREYGLLAPKGMEVDPADTGDSGSEEIHEATE